MWDTTYSGKASDTAGKSYDVVNGRVIVNNSDQQTATFSYYVLNTNSKKFHKDTCSSVKKMNENNKKIYNGTRSEVISMGYTPCSNCNP